MSPQDRALTTQLVYGVMRQQRYLDAWIDRFAQGKLESVVRDILRMSFFQLQFLDRIPDYAAVNAAVEETKRTSPKAARLVNAVLRRGMGQAPNPQSLSLGERYSHPDWLVERWASRYGERLEAVLQRDNEVPALMLRVDLQRTTREQVLQELAEMGIVAQASPYLPEAVRATGALWLEDVPSFQEGLVTVQDESGMLVNWVLDAQPGDTVVDMAVGVGGKAIHALERTAGKIRLTGLDISRARLQQFRDNLARTGYTDGVSIVGQAAERFAPGHAGQFDRVILDAPCSGLGVLRRRVDARWSKSVKELKTLSARQEDMLKAAAGLAKPDGVIVYSTCSTEPEETLMVLERADSFGIEVEDLTPYLPHRAITAFVHQGVLILAPGDLGMDGFFIARLRKKGTA